MMPAIGACWESKRSAKFNASHSLGPKKSLRLHPRDKIAADSTTSREPSELRGADGLAYVALGVFDDVDQESDHRGGELFAADGAGGG